jgi:acetyl esterase/lipase
VAERPAAAASEAAAATPNVLLATKLNVPGLRPEFVARRRLTERLDENLGRALTLVCAPAGYGKTVLLADWARRAQRPAAWLSLDAGDNDPARFWRHTVGALDRAAPGLAKGVGPLLSPPAPASYEALVTALINELAAGPGADEALLVLDDYHLIDSGAVHESLGFLLEHRPPGLHLVLASRSDPPLALPRLRGCGQLTELRAAELRFTADEAATLLRHMAAGAGAVLPDAAVAALVARTEGWAAGLQLAGLSLRGQPDVAGFVAAFAGSHRYVLDFLTEEVLERQSKQVRTFLLETSVLERLSGALCDAVTGWTGSQPLLEQVERAGLFLMPLDEVRGWWRYHHLFADLLRGRMQAEQPARMAELHRNAAAWYKDHGLADDAIRHAAAAGELTWAARLIEQNFDTVYSLRGESTTIHRWLSAIPVGLIESRPRLLLAQAQLAAASGRLDAVEPLLDAAEHAATGAAEEPFEPTIGRAASLMNLPALKALCQAYLAQFRGDAEATAVLATRALAESGEGTLPGSIAQGFLAVAEWLRGHLAAAERAFISSIAGFRAVLRHRAQGTSPALERALDEGLGAGWRDGVDANLAARLGRRPSLARILFAPVSFRRHGVERIANIRYGPALRGNLLDLYRDRADRSARPTLIYLHAGAFRFGSKRLGARHLLYRLASQGWVCVSTNYRLLSAGLADPLIDVKKVIAWVREHSFEYGLDPNAVFLAGSSAGGHPASLAAFTPNDPLSQPGFEGSDTSVAGVIALYGYYGPVDSDQPPSSRLAYSTTKAPPCFAVHGDQDTLVIVEDARGFVEQLRATSTHPVVYAELPGAQHGFDLFRSRRFDTVVDAIEAFTAHIQSRHRAAGLPRSRP